MGEYKKPYLALFNALSTAIEQLEAHKYDLALPALEQAQKDAESIFIDG